MDPLGTTINSRYQISGELGHGGMAEVYKARDIVTGRIVAVKMIRDDTMKDPVNLERFHREAQAMATLSHPNIVNVYDIGEFEKRPYIVSEFVDGMTLRQQLDQKGRLTPNEALNAMSQLCTAVLYAHRNKVIHRDIKPENIFLSPDGTVKLSDFGIASFMNSSHMTKDQRVVGSVHYIAPEIYKGEQATPQSDIYSMGITFYELMTGTLPFEADNPLQLAYKVIKDKFPNIKRTAPDCPDAIASIIYKCCAKSPLDRYQSVYDLREDILKAKNNPDILNKKQSLLMRIKTYFNNMKARRRRHK